MKFTTDWKNLDPKFDGDRNLLDSLTLDAFLTEVRCNLEKVNVTTVREYARKRVYEMAREALDIIDDNLAMILDETKPACYKWRVRFWTETSKLSYTTMYVNGTDEEDAKRNARSIKPIKRASEAISKARRMKAREAVETLRPFLGNFSYSKRHAIEHVESRLAAIGRSIARLEASKRFL